MRDQKRFRVAAHAERRIDDHRTGRSQRRREQLEHPTEEYRHVPVLLDTGGVRQARARGVVRRARTRAIVRQVRAFGAAVVH